MKISIISLTTMALLLMGFINSAFASENSTLYKATETNTLGNPTTITVCRKIGKNLLTPEKQYKFDYNNEELISSKQILKWDADKYEWSISEEYTYEYNVKNQLISQTYTKWDNAEKQDNISAQQMLYIYGADNELITINYIDERFENDLQTNSQNFTYK